MSDVTLKEHIETQIKWVDRHFEAHISTIQGNTERAAAQIEKRLEGMNEFRDALKDQAGTLATKNDLAALREALDTRLKLLELRDARIAGMAAMISIAMSVITALLITNLT